MSKEQKIFKKVIKTRKKRVNRIKHESEKIIAKSRGKKVK